MVVPAFRSGLKQLAADKLLAVFGRAEAPDFVDLRTLEDRFGLDRLFEFAFEPAWFCRKMNRLGWLRRAEFELDDVHYGD
jgi:hypothetical protein